jgi:hypothetical protein
MLIDKNSIIKNACVLSSKKESFISTYIDTQNKIYELKNKPFAMFECKRIGVEEGMRKGPQTIEKAKQGSYVARTVSSLQFITDLLINPQKEDIPIKETFNKSYNELKKGNIFTKVKIDYYADIALTNYFTKNKLRIES